jgi:zinc protease
MKARMAIHKGGSAACFAALLLAAPSFARDFPPEALPPKPVVLPSPALRVLPNGLKVVAIERHLLPLLTLRLVVRSGAESDPATLPGTAQLVSALLTEGTSTRSSSQISEAIDSIGGLIDTGAGWDESYISLSVLNDHEELAFDLLSDMVMHSRFAPAEVERKRRQTLSGLEVVRDDPDYVADAAIRRLAFLGTAYGHPEDGTTASVRRITAEDLRAFYKTYYQPSNTVLAIVGDIDTSEAFARAEKSFGAWTNGAPPPMAAAAAQAPAHRVLAIDKPDAVQTEIRIGNLGVPRRSPDYLALSVADQILGGPSENRLFKALRSHQGLTYGASSELLSYQAAGVWVVKTFTRTPETLKSVHLALEQIKRMHDHPITPQELETAQGYLIGHLALDFESSEDVASQTLELLVYDLPLDYWNRFPDKIRALTSEEVWNAAGRRLAPENNIIVLVGNLSGFEKDLKKLGPVEFVPLAEVDFAAGTLAPSEGRTPHRLRPDAKLRISSSGVTTRQSAARTMNLSVSSVPLKPQHREHGGSQ